MARRKLNTHQQFSPTCIARYGGETQLQVGANYIKIEII